MRRNAYQVRTLRREFLQRLPEGIPFLKALCRAYPTSCRHHLNKILAYSEDYDSQMMYQAFDVALKHNIYSSHFLFAYLSHHGMIKEPQQDLVSKPRWPIPPMDGIQRDLAVYDPMLLSQKSGGADGEV